MFTPDGRFTPEGVLDPRVRAVLVALAARPGHPADVPDLVAAAIRSGDSAVAAVFAAAARPGTPVDGWSDRDQPTDPCAVLTRAGFTAPALRAIDEYAALAQRHADELNGAGLDLLLHRALLHLDAPGRSRLTTLDVDLARALFHRRVAAALTGSGFDDRDEVPPSGLPSELEGADDLTARAKAETGASPFDGVPAYEDLFDRVAQALHRRRARHVFLTGERGVGKAAVVAELARRAVLGRPAFLRGLRVVHADVRRIPPDEARPRLAALLGAVIDRSDLILCVDGFAAPFRADRSGGTTALLLAALDQARCRLIGLVTPREYDDLFADDPDYAEFFNRVDVPEPDTESALGLLRRFARGLEQEFGLGIDDAAVTRAVRLTADYVLNDHLPAKALTVLHRVCEEVDYDRTQRGVSRDRVGEDDVVRAVSVASGVPEETLRGVAERSDYEQSLGEVVFGQPHVIREVAGELGLIKAGMTDPTKPASVLLFLGQTGTGKTEMAKALARFYSASKRLKSYALGNCVEPHSVATIIGVPPGYVGHDQGGRLVTELNADPYGVFLLDEADKAHPDVLHPFLNLFDEGWLSDQRGVRAYAGKSIFVLTSNVGQRMIADWFAQGLSAEEVTAKVKEALPQIRHGKLDRPVFAPEFLARVKRIIVFRPLGHEAMRGIAGKHVRELQQAWAVQRGKRLEVPESLVEAIASRAHELNEKAKGKEGGRIVRRLIADWVETPLQRELTRQPDAYRTADVVALGCDRTSSSEDTRTPEVGVEFRFGE